ncbi:MAG: molybdenum cofactor biosynthesis protein MoaE, partial [Bacteroidetes bacterium]|nr:molybdenum cofactor biosynthesis protein MoaE [Fibrella sp.]
MIFLTTDPIDFSSAYEYLRTDEAGAIDFFFGIVRNNTNAKAVGHLEYEAYDAMAINEMQKIVDEATRRWNVLRCVVVHRKGELRIGETAVLIGVATPHRADAFEACLYIIDTIKQ